MRISHTTVKRIICENRSYKFVRNAHTESMKEFDGDWLKRMTPERGDLRRLSEETGIDENKLSKVMAGTRQIQAHELTAMLDHFGLLVPSDKPLSDKEKELLSELSELKEGEIDHLLSSAKLLRGRPG